MSIASSDLRNYYDNDSIKTTLSSDKLSNKETLQCKICFDNPGVNSQYVVLSCNHVFHVNCLAENHVHDVYKYPFIDEEYFGSRKCMVCNDSIQLEEILFLHTKFLKSTKDYLSSQNTAIESLENQLKLMKKDLRVAYDYRHKIDSSREKSKQIVSTITTMI